MSSDNADADAATITSSSRASEGGGEGGEGGRGGANEDAAAAGLSSLSTSGNLSSSSSSSSSIHDDNVEIIISRQEQRRHRHIARRYHHRRGRGIITFLVDDWLCNTIFSPTTLSGLAKRQGLDGGVNIFRSLWQSLQGIFLPMVFYKTLFQVLQHVQRRILVTVATKSSSSSSPPVEASAAVETIADQVKEAIVASTADRATTTTATTAALSSSSSSSSLSSLRLLVESVLEQAILPSPARPLLSSSSSSTSSSFSFCCWTDILLAAAVAFPRPKQLLMAYLLSPWTISWLLRGVTPLVQASFQVTRTRFLMSRQPGALPEAWQVLSDAIEEGRAYRTRQYDAYLPATTTSRLTAEAAADPSSCVASVPGLPPYTNNNTSISQQEQEEEEEEDQQLYVGDSVILFLPGAGIDSTGYARPAKLLSDCGHVVIVLSSEGCFLRLPSPDMGFDAQYGKRILRQVNRDLDDKLLFYNNKNNHLAGRRPSSQPQDKAIQLRRQRQRTISLVGHSMGGFTASHWVQELNVTKLVLWATLPAFSQHLHDLRNSTSPMNNNDLQVLVLQASNDGLRQVMVESIPPHVLAQRTKTFWQRLPSSKRAHVANVQQQLLVGATHNGFGSNEPGTFLPRPEVQGIPLWQQQRIAVSMTHEFLVRNDQEQQQQSQNSKAGNKHQLQHGDRDYRYVSY